MFLGGQAAHYFLGHVLLNFLGRVLLASDLQCSIWNTVHASRMVDTDILSQKLF